MVPLGKEQARPAGPTSWTGRVLSTGVRGCPPHPDDLLDRFRSLITEQTTITEHTTTLRTQTASNQRTTPGG
jgi:hypothetical protein